MARNGRRNADEALALALAAGQTLRDAAGVARVAERTAARRWADAAFRQRVAELRGEMVSRAMGRMTDGMADAADKLRQLLTAESESVRLGAARSILELGAKLRETAGERGTGDGSPIDTGGVVKVLAARLRQIDASDLPTGEKSRLTVSLAETLLRAIGLDVVAKRLEALQAVLIGRKDKER